MSTNAGFTEGQTGRVLLKDVEPRCVEAMVYFFYNQKYHYGGYDESWIPHGWPKGPLAPICEAMEAAQRNQDARGNNEEDDEPEDAEQQGDQQDPWANNSIPLISIPLISSAAPNATFPKLSEIPVFEPMDQDHKEDRLDFHLGMCILAERYNIKGLRLAAEDRIVKQHLGEARSYAELSSIVDNILDSDAPESLRKKVISSVMHQTENLHSNEPDSLLDRRPELAVEILKNVAERRHVKHVREQRNRQNRQYEDYRCYSDGRCPHHPDHPLCVADEWPEAASDIGWENESQ